MKLYHTLCLLLTSDNIFWLCALAGSGMFLMQFIMNLLSTSVFEDLNADSDLVEHSALDHADTSRFKWLSIQTIMGFLMMFGWTALTCQKEFGLHLTATLAISLTVGVLTAMLMRSILRLAKKLISPGSLFRLDDAIGQEGYVYQHIPKDGRGKISITVAQLTHEIEAISNHSEELPSFMRVKVIAKNDDKTVIVTPL